MTKITDVVDSSMHGEIAVVTIDSPPVNALNASVRLGIHDAMLAAHADPKVKAIVLICAGKTFIAGADIREFGQPAQGVTLLTALEAIENGAKPVIAAMHGTALGGGLEVAMACHFRIAAPGTKFGLPEVKLGILAGSGGTQRLPRLVGVQRALDMMISGDPIGADDALSSGLIDELASGELLEQALLFARKVVADARPIKKVRDQDAKLEAAKQQPELFANARKSFGKKRGFPAPEKIVQCVEMALQKPFDEARQFERQNFVELMASSESKAQRYYFFAEREAAKIPDLPADVPLRPIAKVGIIGAGTMGGGIAMNFLNTGIAVTIVEAKAEALERGVGVIRKNYERTASKGKLTAADVETRMGLLKPTLELEQLADCDLIIEAVFESMAIKKEVFEKLDRICKPGAILASNTSYLDINEIANCTKRPGDVIGLHFFSPANVMKLLEIVRGKATNDDVIATSMALAKRIGKISVLVGVCRGFVGNRILAVRRDQANQLMLEGVLPWEVDRVLEDFGMPMGPFAMSDLAGLDIGWSAEKSQPDKILRDKLCELGRRGQKTNAGFYNYDPKTRERSVDLSIATLVAEYAKRAGFEQRTVSDQEILERCLYPMVNEGAKILEEGIALRASDIDVVWVNGYGWPVYRGGPMFWAQSEGLPKIVETLERYATRLGKAYQPSPLLERLASEGKGFTR